MSCDLNSLLLPGEWQTPVYNSGWSNSIYPVKFRLEGDVVRIVGTTLGGTGIAFVLPEEYRPSVDRRLAGGGGSQGGPAIIDSDGSVTPFGSGSPQVGILDGTFPL